MSKILNSIHAFLVAVILLLTFTNNAFALENWEFELAPYIWMVSMNGDGGRPLCGNALQGTLIGACDSQPQPVPFADQHRGGQEAEIELSHPVWRQRLDIGSRE